MAPYNFPFQEKKTKLVEGLHAELEEGRRAIAELSQKGELSQTLARKTEAWLAAVLKDRTALGLIGTAVVVGLGVASGSRAEASEQGDTAGQQPATADTTPSRAEKALDLIKWHPEDKPRLAAAGQVNQNLTTGVTV